MAGAEPVFFDSAAAFGRWLERQHDSGGLRAVRTNDIDRFANGGACGDHVVHDQHAT